MHLLRELRRCEPDEPSGLGWDGMTAAAPERARWPRLAAAPHPLLRPLLPRGYVGFTRATTPRHLVLPATTSVPLVVRSLIRRTAPRPSS